MVTLSVFVSLVVPADVLVVVLVVAPVDARHLNRIIPQTPEKSKALVPELTATIGKNNLLPEFGAFVWMDGINREPSALHSSSG